MPDYKKKKVSRIKRIPKHREKVKEAKALPPENIQMNPINTKSTTSTKDKLRVLKGKKLEKKRRLKVLLLCISALVVVTVVLSLILPVGILENIGNAVAVIGNGSYPVELSSTETINAVSKSSYYYVLTNNQIDAFTAGGKKIFSNAHGYENPVLKTSVTRAMVFDQNGTDAVIYNLSKKTQTIKTEANIITANISRSGVYAVVTYSDTYAGVVSVYSKTGKLIYEWYSSEDMINNVVVSPNGKKIAVSTLNAANGQYKSKIYVLTFDSANPVFTDEYTDSIVYTLDSSTNQGFSVITSNSYRFITWSKYTKSQYDNEYSVSMFRPSSGNMLVVFNRSSDKTDNRIALFSSSGQKVSEFNFNGTISDIEVSGGHIYCISDTNVYMLDNSGNRIRSAECGFGGVRLAVLSTYSVAVITDNDIEKVQIEKG